MKKTANTIGETTYSQIKSDIIFGVLAPGSKLKLEALKTHYTASNSTLRETLNRLASDGFVLAEEQRGFFVKPVSQEDLIEISQLRILLEAHALRQSIKHGDTNWEGNLVAAHHKLHSVEKRMLSGDMSDKKLWKQYDWEFHLALIQACDGPNLLQLHGKLFDQYLRYQMLVLTNRGQVAVDEHKQMLQAALDRDTDRSIQLLEQHVLGGLEHTIREFPVI